MRFINDAAYIYSIALVIYALLSWFPGGYDSAFGRFLSKICEPYLSLFDRLHLRFGGLDFTIIIAAAVLNLAVRGLNMIIYNLL